MNHLAHLYLSRHSEKMMVGNFIADGVKGKKYSDFDFEIAEGILMHREIDTFTDSHAIVKHSKSFLREKYGLYSSVIVDVFYDHFLAKNWLQYSDIPLEDFSAMAYDIFFRYFHVLPSRYQRMLPYMQKENWLLNYAKTEGIERSLNGMSRRIVNNPGIEHSATELKLNYEIFQKDFAEYFPKLVLHISTWNKKMKRGEYSNEE